MRFATTIEFDATDVVEGELTLKFLAKSFKEQGTKAQIGPLIDVVAANPDAVIIHTDGGCDQMTGLGAWAYIIQAPGEHLPTMRVHAMTGTTNNRMELMALLRALEDAEIGRPIRVILDSEYVRKGIEFWVKNWVKNGWKNYLGKPVANRDLWEPLSQLAELHCLTFQTVKGHSGVEGNEIVDSLCTKAMKAAAQGKTKPVPDNH